MAKRNQSESFRFVAGVVAALLVTGTGAAWWAFHNLNASSPPTRSPNIETVVPPSISEKPNTAPKSPIQKPENDVVQSPAKIYWVVANQDKLVLASSPVSVQKLGNKNQVLQTDLEQLLSQTPTPPTSTVIPTGTQLLSFKANPQGVHLNLSAAFTEGGGSDSMAGRLGQVLYTASSLDPSTPVWISVEGKPLETLGGEGLMIEQPITRQWFKENFEM